MKAVRYDQFSGVNGLYISDLPEPEPQPHEIVVRVVASALNPGALPSLHGSSFVPGRDIAGTVVAVGADVKDFDLQDAVLGRLQSWDAHAEMVSVPANQVVPKPETLSWDVAGALFTTPMAGMAAVKAVSPAAGDVVIISGASGGVGFTAAQLAVRRSATVIGLTSLRHFGLLQRHNIDPVTYGDGEEDRILNRSAGRPITAFIDTVGGNYIKLALRLGVAPERINTVVDYRGAAENGVKALGTSDAGGLAALAELARMADKGELNIPIAQTFSLDAVQDAYRALADRNTHGRIILHPNEAS